MKKANSELKTTKGKLAGREKSLTDITERKSTARKSLDQIKEEKLHVDIEISKLATIKANLEEKLTEAIAKITNLEKQIEEAKKGIEKRKCVRNKRQNLKKAKISEKAKN